MDPIAMLLKPGAFRVKVKGDPEQLLQDFNEYVELIDKLFTAMAALARHTQGHTDCETCRRAKAMLALIGGKEMDGLIKHMGKVTDDDTYQQAINKIKTGIMAQTN